MDDEGQTMVNSPRRKLTWSKAPGELTIKDLQDGCCGGPMDIVTKCFSNSESPCSPCCPNASQQVLAQSDLPFGSR